MSSESIYSYEAFDLNFVSKGLNITELVEVYNSNKSKVYIEECDSSIWPKLTSGKYDTKFLQMSNAEIRLNINGIGKIRIIGGNRILWTKESQNVLDQDLITFILGSAIGAILIQRGTLVLHGNSLVKDNHAIICLGHSGFGKSTLASGCPAEACIPLKSINGR